MFNRIEIKSKAKQAVKANLFYCSLAFIIFSIISNLSHINQLFGANSQNTLSQYQQIFNTSIGLGEYSTQFSKIMIHPIIFLIISICCLAITCFVVLPAEIGYMRFLLNNRNGEEKNIIENMFFVFKENKIIQVFKTMLVYRLIVGIAYVFCIIPGVILNYKWKFIPFIISENPDITFKEAKQKSEEMTNGHLLDLFTLDCSFIGWQLLSVCCTCGLLNVIFVTPYVNQTLAEAYYSLNNSGNNYNGNYNNMNNQNNYQNSQQNNNYQYQQPIQNYPPQENHPQQEQYCQPQQNSYPNAPNVSSQPQVIQEPLPQNYSNVPNENIQYNNQQYSTQEYQQPNGYYQQNNGIQQPYQQQEEYQNQNNYPSYPSPQQ